jgi:hypothetical protein
MFKGCVRFNCTLFHSEQDSQKSPSHSLLHKYSPYNGWERLIGCIMKPHTVGHDEGPDGEPCTASPITGLFGARHPSSSDPRRENSVPSN